MKNYQQIEYLYGDRRIMTYQRINCRWKHYSMYEWYNYMRIEKLSADGTVTEFGDGIGANIL